MKQYIFGAKATAVGLYKALTDADKTPVSISGFIVSDRTGNPNTIWGCPVLVLEKLASDLSEEEKAASYIYVAVPELIHGEIRRLLNEKGFFNLDLIDARKEAAIMEEYFRLHGLFPSIHSLKCDFEKEIELPNITIYAASFYKDKPLNNPPLFPEYIKKIYLGCEGAKSAEIDINGQADHYDDTGDNISSKNPNRCEMTAHYWIWKNRLQTKDDYVGVCHYRRLLDIGDEDLRRIKANDVDVVMPFPMIHYPNAEIQHSWYVPEKDWNIMREALSALYPEYAACFDTVFGQPYFYNYNMLIAKKNVFSDFCAWLYPILDYIENHSEPKGEDRRDRYTAYLSESLTTLYFMANIKKLKIYHTGRLLYT